MIYNFIVCLGLSELGKILGNQIKTPICPAKSGLFLQIQVDLILQGGEVSTSRQCTVYSQPQDKQTIDKVEGRMGGRGKMEEQGGASRVDFSYACMVHH